MSTDDSSRGIQDLVYDLLVQGKKADALYELQTISTYSIYNLAMDLILEKKALEASVVQFRGWVNDLQSGCFINCVYCGHRYGPDSEVRETMQQVLYDHIEKCPDHPLSAARKKIEDLEKSLVEYNAIKASLNALTSRFDSPEQVIGIAQVLATMMVESHAEEATFTLNGTSWRNVLLGDFTISITKTGGPDVEESAKKIREMKMKETE